MRSILTLESPRLSAALQKKLGGQFSDVKSVLGDRTRGVTTDPDRFRGLDPRARRARGATRPRTSWSTDRQEKTQAKLAGAGER